MSDTQVRESQARAQARDAAEGGRLLEGLAKRVGATARASSVFGEPVERDGVTVVPVARARWGFGGGCGTHDGEGGSGGGGGGIVDPVGYIEIRGGSATFKPVRDPLKWAALIVGAVGLALVRAWRRRAPA